MNVDALNLHPKRILRVLLVFRQLEERQQYPTYGGVQLLLGYRERESVYKLILRARRLGLVETVKTGRGGLGHKAVFRLTAKGKVSIGWTDESAPAAG